MDPCWSCPVLCGLCCLYQIVSLGSPAAFAIDFLFRKLPTVTFLYYMSLFDYKSNYPTGLSTAVLLCISIPVSAFLRLILFLGLVIPKHVFCV